ncbi:MAG: undecaprenyl/decaprenyl-phosphate alpha-N-acetylglucosaminyl 1-phosphate transferase [Gemmatimonadetes bacterium]|jgi:UDP-GlcNAc:undecaprenyl-phosphate/decaprenyl-phosphate GlcNAc-1-phosphate transferase|nr:undecaprenyl/decaprenyl-phosphate alpha-N-acetylglucosaminyl 1-phosphate transferase [Gemmatimonadota bacterium]MBT6144610.1 undecaprenyl/decaprenyl-phosphate alpha-N-acetylglucosaminyl 1-phosphate transferase [Gemmatimonadota bacterium]MBT7860444.1 undecaprenyl/decaprenyl-phosphate alpha-N-acetylglucosaminyl 1-phosphate transferase [Gemmatimonadota bacterium]
MTISLLFPMLALVGLAISAASVPFLRRVALNTGLVDDPASGDYKTHAQPTPYGGGIAIALGVLIPAIATLWWIVTVRPYLMWEGGRLLNPWSSHILFPLEPLSPTILQLSQTISLLLAATVIFALGLADDWRRLPAGLRLAVQVVAATFLVAAVPGFRPHITGLMVFDSIAAIVWLVAMTNAFNFLDNMNGLSAGVGAISIAALASMALACAHLPAAGVGLLIVGAAGGFLLYNFPQASIFMGDAGGLFIGFIGGALALLVTGRVQDLSDVASEGLVAWLPVCCLIVAIYDLSSVVLLRLMRRVPPWRGDTNHISHRLVALGLRRTDAVLVIYLTTSATATAAVVAFSRPQWALWSILCLILFIAGTAIADVRQIRRSA